MKSIKKALAMILAISTIATVPVMAETTATEEVSTPVAVEGLYGTDIDEAGEALGLEKVLTQGEDDAFLTMYENEDIMLCGRDGAVIDMTIFNDTYSLYGVVIGMSVEDAKAALEANGVAYTDGELMELEIATIEFTMPGNDAVSGYFDTDEGVITGTYLNTNVDDEVAAEEAESTEVEAGKATPAKKASGYLKLTGTAYLRKTADKESKQLKTMEKGSKLKYTATATDSRGVTWYKVRYEGKTGWVSSKNTKSIKKSEYDGTSYTVKKDSGWIATNAKVNVRREPDKSAEQIGTLAKGTTLTYNAVSTDSRGVTWYRISYKGTKGWISSKNTEYR